MVVQPTLEYAYPAWSTSLTLGLQSDVEWVQRYAMNIIYPKTPYVEGFSVNSYVNISSHKSNSRSTNCINYY